jgi:hypothetical protein
MKAEWVQRREQPEVMAAFLAAVSEGHKGRWTDEQRAAVRATVDRLHTPEARAKKSASLRGKKWGLPAMGRFVSESGYHGRTMQYDHPLATTGAIVMEHRAVLYDKIGSGPHECHWHFVYDCGKTDLHWGGLDGICVDHLDHDKANNDPTNLVPSCCGCNLRRGREFKLISELQTRGIIQLVADQDTKMMHPPP